jgi:hypothetical protein
VGLAIHRGKRKSSLKPVKQSGGQNYGQAYYIVGLPLLVMAPIASTPRKAKKPKL